MQGHWVCARLSPVSAILWRGTMAEKISLAVLLSGSGRTLQNFIEEIEAGRLDANITVVISSRKDAYGLVRARERGIPAVAIPSKKFRDFDALSDAIAAELRKHPIDLIALAGFMCFFRIPPEFEGRIMNIHPALIPLFCGKGFYGHIVHDAVLEQGCKVSGCTVHFADNEYDHGPIIVQRCVPVLEDDTPDTLGDRVFEQELKAYPEAIQLFAEGRLRIEGNKARILSEKGSQA